MPLTAGEDDQIAGLQVYRVMPGEIQPARASEHQVKLGHAGPVDLEAPWLTELRQAVHGAAHPQRRQQLADRIRWRGVQLLHRHALWTPGQASCPLEHSQRQLASAIIHTARTTGPAL